MHHVILDSHRALHSLQWPLVSDSWTWGEVKLIMATLNLNRRCNPLIRWKYLFYYAYSSNFHAYRTEPSLSKQSLSKRIGLLQDRNGVTIQKTSSETKLCRILPLPPRVMSCVSKFTYDSFIHIAYDSSNQDHQFWSQNAFTSASGTRQPPWT